MRQQRKLSCNLKFGRNLVCFIINLVVIFKFNVGLFYYFCKRMIALFNMESGPIVIFKPKKFKNSIGLEARNIHRKSKNKIN